ncbi:MAG: DNA translocase FtsK [Anaerolineaceae bacterium]
MSPREQVTRQGEGKREHHHANTPASSSGWLEELGVFWMKFSRIGWDGLGLLLLAISILTLLGLVQLSRGILISLWVNFLQVWFGWGSSVLALTIGFFGVYFLRVAAGVSQKMSLKKVLVVEGLFFTLLAMASLINRNSLARASDGQDGGLIGWGLATFFSKLLPTPLNSVVVGGLTVLFLILTIGMPKDWTGKLDRRIKIIRSKIKLPDFSWLQTGAADGNSPNKSRLTNHEKVSPPANPKMEPIPIKPSAVSAVNKPQVKRLPPLNLLMHEQSVIPDPQKIQVSAALLEKTLSDFGLPSRVTGYRVGPTVTQFAVEPGFIEKTAPDGSVTKQKIRVAQISVLARDLALALSAERLRIEAPVPGHSFVGIEIPNQDSSAVKLRPLLDSDSFKKTTEPLSIALGKDVSGQPVVMDLAKMPHLLVAGTTNSGKSVCIAAIATCLVMNNSPAELRVAMLDPKKVELIRFNGLPHLLGPVETELNRMLAVLRWAKAEMDNRYRLLENVHARDLEGLNQKYLRHNQEPLPRIVIFIDELADLMMSAMEETESSLVRLAQMARATGIHLIVATQRPSTDVVTGLIKANFPARIAFNVASSVDSRVILDASGAETLLGKGDLLFLNPNTSGLQRAQGVMVTDQEIGRIIEFWQKMSPVDGTAKTPWENLLSDPNEMSSDRLLDEAVAIVKRTQRANTSMLQRKLHIGFPRAAKLIDQMEEMGVVGPSQGAGRDREVLMEADDDLEENTQVQEDS